MVKPTLQFTTANGVSGTSHGAGRPLVFLHGWCLDGRMWMYAEHAFSRTHRTVVLDLAGFGRSRMLPGPYAWDRYADDVGQVLDELHLSDAVLVGFAFGAGIAMTLAARGHPRIAGVVSVGAPGAEYSPYAKMAKAILRDWPDFARRSAKALFHRQQSEATLAWLERIFASAPLPPALAVLDLLAAFDPRPLASRISVRQLFVQGSEDTVSPVGLGTACAALAPDAGTTVVPDCGHLIVLDAKDAFHDTLRGFLTGLSDGSPDAPGAAKELCA